MGEESDEWGNNNNNNNNQKKRRGLWNGRQSTITHNNWVRF